MLNTHWKLCRSFNVNRGYRRICCSCRWFDSLVVVVHMLNHCWSSLCADRNDKLGFGRCSGCICCVDSWCSVTCLSFTVGTILLLDACLTRNWKHWFNTSMFNISSLMLEKPGSTMNTFLLQFWSQILNFCMLFLSCMFHRWLCLNSSKTRMSSRSFIPRCLRNELSSTCHRPTMQSPVWFPSWRYVFWEM